MLTMELQLLIKIKSEYIKYKEISEIMRNIKYPYSKLEGNKCIILG